MKRSGIAIWPLQVIRVLHHIQTNYTNGVCLCFVRPWLHSYLIYNEIGGKLHVVVTTAQLTMQIFWTNDVSAVGQPSPHTAWLICLYQSSQLPKGSPDRASISIPHKPNHGPGGPPLMSSHCSCRTRYQRSDLLPLHAIQRFTLLEYFHPGHFPLWKC